MLTLDEDELELAVMALRVFRALSIKEADGNLTEWPAKACCRHVAAQCDTLIDRIEQHQQDEEEEKADAGTS